MEFYKEDNTIFLKISKEELIDINFINKKEYVCTYSFSDKIKCGKIKKYDIYEIVFDDNLKKSMLKAEKYIPSDIQNNCIKCNYYEGCKNKSNMFKNIKKTNKILQEYKNFIHSLKEDDAYGYICL